MTPEQLAALTIVTDVAMPGPWTIELDGGPGVLVCDDVRDTVGRIYGDNDAAFIAAARAAMPELLEIAKLARELTVALNGVLGTNSDEPGFEEKWDAAEVACQRAREVFGMTKKEGG